MPAIQMFGRRWALAADDIPVLAFPAAVFHGIWFIFLVVGFSAIQRPSACAKVPSYETCIIGLFICFFLSCVLEGWLVREGLKGSVFEVEKRKRVVPLLYAQLLVAVAEVGFLVLGTILIFKKRPKCYDEGFTLWHSQGVVDVIVWTTWGVLIFMGSAVFVTYSLFPQYNSKASWERRCRVLSFCLCCSTRMAGNTGGVGVQADQPDPVGRMAELFAQIFEHVDMVTTDILGAFLMAAAAQQCKRRATVAAMVNHSDSSAQSDIPVGAGVPCFGGSLRDLKPQTSSSHLLASSSSSVSQRDSNSGWVNVGSGRDPQTPQMEAHGKEAGLTADDTGPGMHLLTPSGIAAELRPHWTPLEAAQMQGPHYQGVDPKDLGEASHYCRFAFAAYGYMLFIWSRPQVRGWCQLCCGRRCSCWTHPVRRYMRVMLSEQRQMPKMSDLKVTNLMNREAIQQMTGLPNHDVVFIRFQNEAISHQCLPYFIAIDEHSNSVVLSIRGTLSLEDCVTDFMCEPVDLDEWIKEVKQDATPINFSDRLPQVKAAGPETKASGHSGILEAAKAVLEDLQSTGTLQELMQEAPREGLKDCRGWKLVVTGHSLGAGAAVLVALYLRNFFPRVNCWAFSPPGGVADPNVAEAAQDFCTSVVLGKDWIPRLTVGSFARLRDEMIMAAVRCKQSKLRFFLGALLGKEWREEDIFLPEDAVKHRANQMLQRYKAEAQQGHTRRQDRYAASRNFVPPGRLMFLRPVKSAAKERRSRRRYLPVWITAQELMQEGVLVSPRMMADHMPDYLTAVLQRLAEKAGQSNSANRSGSGNFVIDIPPSPPVAKRASRDYEGRSLQHILRNSLATARAYPESEEEVELS